jgi:multidrug efflux pump subunit AcrA (membrane-fusion protein)
MDMDISDKETPTADDLLASTEAMLARAAVQFERAVGRLERAELPAPKTVTASMDGYMMAFFKAMSERDKVGKLRNQIAGTVGCGVLDLDAARVEIGRRLACLRDA